PGGEFVDDGLKRVVGQDVDLQRVVDRAVYGSAATDGLHQPGLADRPTHSLRPRVGMDGALDGCDAAVAHQDAALLLRIPLTRRQFGNVNTEQWSRTGLNVFRLRL